MYTGLDKTKSDWSRDTDIKKVGGGWKTRTIDGNRTGSLCALVGAEPWMPVMMTV